MANVTSQKNTDAIARVGDVLEDYAQRGVFRSFARGPVNKGVATYRMLWHHNRVYELTFDPAKNVLRFTGLLPDVPPDAPMYKALRAFIRKRQSHKLPEHRRIDPVKVQVRTYNRSGSVTLTIQAKDGDVGYAARKLIHLVHEIFLDFLHTGHYEYLVQSFGLNEDQF